MDLLLDGRAWFKKKKKRHGLGLKKKKKTWVEKMSRVPSLSPGQLQRGTMFLWLSVVIETVW